MTRSYRPGDRGPRNPITPAQVACAREYRALGMSWHRVAAVLRVAESRIREATLAAGADARGDGR